MVESISNGKLSDAICDDPKTIPSNIGQVKTRDFLIDHVKIISWYLF